MICPACRLETLVYVPGSKEEKIEKDPDFELENKYIYREYECSNCDTSVITKESVYMTTKIERI